MNAPPTDKNDTPRTDAAAVMVVNDQPFPLGHLAMEPYEAVPAEVARQIERELAEAMRVVRETERVGGKALAALSAERAIFSADQLLQLAEDLDDIAILNPQNILDLLRAKAAKIRKHIANAPRSAIRTIKYLVRSGGECPGDWLCKDIPEVQAALCDTLYGRRKDLDADEIHEIGQYLAQVQKMSKRELHYTFEDGWLTIIKVIQTEHRDA